MARRMGAQYIECSSKETQNVDEVFELAVNTAVGQELDLKKAREAAQRQNAMLGAGMSGKAKKAKRRDCVIL